MYLAQRAHQLWKLSISKRNLEIMVFEPEAQSAD